MTKQKKLVLTIIERSHGHLSAEEIFFRAREEMPNIALGTVYRNLNALTEEGIVRRITLPGTSDRFDTMIRPHDHLICQRCGRIKDVHLREWRRLSAALQEMISRFMSSTLIIYVTNVERKKPARLPENDRRVWISLVRWEKRI